MSLGTAHADDEAIYQITAVKGKALIDLPNGNRELARPGMRVNNGARIMVLEKSLVRGFDIQNKCEVEYRERVNTRLYRGKICHGEALAQYRPPAAIRPMTKPITKGGAVLAGGSFAPGANVVVPAVLGLGAVALLANDDDDDNNPASR